MRVAMEQSQRRTEVMGPLRDRVAKAVGARLDDKLSLQLALACAMREPDDLVQFIAPRHVAAAVLKHRAAVAVTPEEWSIVFGHDAPPLRDGGITAVVQSGEFQPEIARIGESMKCTVAETEQGVRYARAWTRALCYVAVHFEEADDALASAVGTLVRADARRMEELRETLDEEGVETILMTKMLKALSESVV